MSNVSDEAVSRTSDTPVRTSDGTASVVGVVAPHGHNSSSAASSLSRPMGRPRSATLDKRTKKLEKKRSEMLASRLAKFKAMASSTFDDTVPALWNRFLPADGTLIFLDLVLRSDTSICLSAAHVTVLRFPEGSLVTAYKGATVTENDAIAKKMVVDVIAVSDIATIYDSSTDECSLFLFTTTPKHMSHRDYEKRLLTFETRSTREHFIAHLYLLGQQRQGATIELCTWD